MGKIKENDIVVRKSYKKDLIFYVDKITQEKVYLKGIINRIEADAPITDLELIGKNKYSRYIDNFDNRIKQRISKSLLMTKKIKKQTGKILHLDGDKKYSQKANRYYQAVGLNAIVKNIDESKQPKILKNLLVTYNPDILIVTGHDAMYKKSIGYYNINNYRNSKYFVECVKLAREYDLMYNKTTVIFAGACQSYFEALIAAGANFASSPGRILIDFLDPIVVAETIACTKRHKYVTINDIVEELRDGKIGVDGIGANGRLRSK